MIVTLTGFRVGSKASVRARKGGFRSGPVSRRSQRLRVVAALLVALASSPILSVPVGQSEHARHADIARRATVSHMRALVLSGKSGRSYPTSRALQEGRFAIVTIRGVRDAMAATTSGALRKTTDDVADDEVVWS